MIRHIYWWDDGSSQVRSLFVRGERRVKGGHTNLQCCMILYDISQSLLVYEMKLMYVYE
jgi:hypothetical protein